MELRLDYVTANFDAGTVTLDSICSALAGRSDLCFSSRSDSETARKVSPFGLSYMHNSGNAARPHCLRVSGVGCKHFLPSLPQLVDLCKSNGGDLSFSRLDFAFDVLIPDVDWKEFIKKAFSSSIDSDRKYKQYRLAGSGLAMTIYIGSRLSDFYFRIYNKSLEDKHYQYFEDGKPVVLPDGYSVIRYEVEIKRHVHIKNGSRTVFDPSEYFYQFYNSDPLLAQKIKDLWLSWGDDVLLPSDFVNANLTISSKNKNFASISSDKAVELVQDKLEDKPRTFQRTIDYVVSHFGKYLPFIYADRDYVKTCEFLCKQFCGFIPAYCLDNFVHSDLLELDDDTDVPFEPVQYEIDTFEEMEV